MGRDLATSNKYQFFAYGHAIFSVPGKHIPIFGHIVSKKVPAYSRALSLNQSANQHAKVPILPNSFQSLSNYSLICVRRLMVHS